VCVFGTGGGRPTGVRPVEWWCSVVWAGLNRRTRLSIMPARHEVFPLKQCNTPMLKQPAQRPCARENSSARAVGGKQIPHGVGPKAAAIQNQGGECWRLNAGVHAQNSAKRRVVGAQVGRAPYRMGI